MATRNDKVRKLARLAWPQVACMANRNDKVRNSIIALIRLGIE